MSDLESLLYVLSTLIVTLLELVFPTILLYLSAKAKYISGKLPPLFYEVKLALVLF